MSRSISQSRPGQMVEGRPVTLCRSEGVLSESCVRAQWPDPAIVRICGLIFSTYFDSLESLLTLLRRTLQFRVSDIFIIS